MKKIIAIGTLLSVLASTSAFGFFGTRVTNYVSATRPGFKTYNGPKDEAQQGENNAYENICVSFGDKLSPTKKCTTVHKYADFIFTGQNLFAALSVESDEPVMRFDLSPVRAKKIKFISVNGEKGPTTITAFTEKEKDELVKGNKEAGTTIQGMPVLERQNAEIID